MTGFFVLTATSFFFYQAYLNRQDARELSSHVFYSNQVLCHTLNGNPVPVLTITSKNNVKVRLLAIFYLKYSPNQYTVHTWTSIYIQILLFQCGSYVYLGVLHLQDKEVIFFTGRVHPGESNSSWVMEGVLDQLLRESSISNQLLDKFIFKIVPMLNPEGVIHGK